VLRASAVCEEAGYPTSSLVCEGFLGQAAATTGLGMKLPFAKVPGHTQAQSADELRRNILEVTLDQAVGNLTAETAAAREEREPGAREVVCVGGLDEVNQFFIDKEWSDGLPIIPPTRQKVDAFLRLTDRGPDESLGTILPDSRVATVWSIAVNGVMAGCRPEYMPILVALVEAMCDPQYGVEHSGNTPGADTLIILNGPIIKRLGSITLRARCATGFSPTLRSAGSGDCI